MKYGEARFFCRIKNKCHLLVGNDNYGNFAAEIDEFFSFMRISS